jgi:hypothetical protein
MKHPITKQKMKSNLSSNPRLKLEGEYLGSYTSSYEVEVALIENFKGWSSKMVWPYLTSAYK